MDSSKKAQTSAANADHSSRSKPMLSLFDCVGVIVGIIIGSGIYKTTPLIAAMTGGVSGWLLEVEWIGNLPAVDSWLPVAVLSGAWMLGAAIALCGALCYAELASAYPHHGGDFDYLNRAFGKRAGFFFIWCEFWIVRPANIGAVAFVFAEYGLRFVRSTLGFSLGAPGEMWSIGSWEIEVSRCATIATALLAVIGLTLTNLAGVRTGIRVQNTLSVAKMLGLLGIVAVAFLLPARGEVVIVPFEPPAAGSTSFALAMVLIMFTLGGWNDLAFVSAEVQNPRRNLLWGLLLGLAAVTAIYVLVSIAFVYGLGFGGVVSSSEVAADLLASRVGTFGDSAIAALIAISTLGAINGMLYAGARMYYALGVDYPTFSWLGVWNAKWGGPVRGLFAQTVIVIGLIISFGLYSDGFERLVNFSTLFFWSFFFLVGIALIVLRKTDPLRDRPYRIIAYPVTPILFCLSSLYVLYSSVMYASSQGGWEWGWAAAIVLIGDWITQQQTPQSTGPLSNWKSGRRPGTAVLGRWSLSGVVLSGIGVAVMWTGNWWWIGELFSHLPLQIGVAATLSALAARWAGRRHVTIIGAALAAVCFAWVAWSTSPSIASRTADEAAENELAKPLSIASLNVLVHNSKHAEVLKTIRDLDVDVVVVCEVNAAWAEQLKSLQDVYPYIETVAREDAFGIAILSRVHLATSLAATSSDSVPQLLGRLNRETGDVWYVGATHVLPPMSPSYLASRNADLQSWSSDLALIDHPVVMIGDFNDTPWSAPFRQRLRSGKWHDSRVGFGLQPTWPTWLGACGIPIDHALLNEQVAAKSRTTFEIPGSDHLGIRLELVRVPRRENSNEPAAAEPNADSNADSNADANADATVQARSAATSQFVSTSAANDSPQPSADAHESKNYRAEGEHGVIATVQPGATDAGMKMFAQSGNAVDAAIAAALALGVVDGHNSGIGGGCLILIRTADGRVLAIDGRETAPAAVTRDTLALADSQKADGADPVSQTGALAVAVPGAIAAYEMALEQAGSLSLAEVLQPGIQLAEEGFEVDRELAQALKRNAETLALFPGSAAILLHEDASPYVEGERLMQRDLAATYRAIAEQGSEWFYRGPFAEQVAVWMLEHGGLLTTDDFRNYHAIERRPIESMYRGHRIVGFPPPSSGGLHIAQMLTMLERFDLEQLEQDDPLQSAHVVVEAMKLAFADRAYWLGDADFAKVPAGLLDSDYLAQRSAEIDPTRVVPVTSHGEPPEADREFLERHTTHIAAADSQGNWVAITATINTSFGSKVIVPGTGVLLNNEMDDFAVSPGMPNAFGLIGAEANSVQPGKRPLSSMSPTLVFLDDQPILAVGAAGGPKIITQVLWTLIRTIDLKQDLSDAIAGPRLHHQWSPDRLSIENGFDPAIAEALAKLGHDVRFSDLAGIGQGVTRSADGRRLIGVHDPRVPGKAAAW